MKRSLSRIIPCISEYVYLSQMISLTESTLKEIKRRSYPRDPIPNFENYYENIDIFIFWYSASKNYCISKPNKKEDVREKSHDKDIFGWIRIP